MASNCIGSEVAALKPLPGEVLLLENLRFHPHEEGNDPEFSRQLASLADVYVNDAFGSAHRAHASTVGIIAHLPQAAAGLLMDRELEWLTKATKNPDRPCVALLGGAKVSDKIEVIENLMKVVDTLLIGGAMAYTFLRAQGQNTGKSLVEEDKIDLARQLLASANGKIVLPVDHVVVREVKAGASNEVVERIGDGQIAVDIGPKTISNYEKIIAGAKTSSGMDRWAFSKCRRLTKEPSSSQKQSQTRGQCLWWAEAIRKRRSSLPVSPIKSLTFLLAAAPHLNF